MSRIRMTLTGDKAMKQRLKNVAGDNGLRKEARGALLELGDALVVKIQDRSPKKTGKMAASTKRRALVSGKKQNMRVTITQGGEEAPYAPIVHETHPTQSKWMEATLNEAVPTALQDLEQNINLKRAAGGGA